MNLINGVWLSLMCCFNEIMELHGDNHYKLPYMGKACLECLNLLPALVEVSDLALEAQWLSCDLL
jgi:hypothetical protein